MTGASALTRMLVENDVRTVDLGRKTSCFAGITMLLSYTLWSVAAKLWGETRVNGWRMCWFGYLGTRITGTCSADYCLAEGQRKPSRINLSQLGATWPKLDNQKTIVFNRRRTTLYGRDTSVFPIVSS